MTEILKWASYGETTVVRALVSKILEKGYSIRVHDGENWATKITKDETTILEALCSSSDDTIQVFEGGDNVYRCQFWLVYHNAVDGSELLADWTDVALANEILQEIGYMEV